nr:MAG TPA: hypothetical protein [Caudoviricetes sp.]DAZ29520.1 MAG TPA: hypothetical protein [Caudoviricetes sp.]
MAKDDIFIVTCYTKGLLRKQWLFFVLLCKRYDVILV